MKFKTLLTKSLLVVAGLCAGANGAWADTTIGNTANEWRTDGSYTSAATLSAGETRTFTFTVDELGTTGYDSYCLNLSKLNTPQVFNTDNYFFIRSSDFWHSIGDESTTLVGQANTFGETTVNSVITGATVIMTVSRIGNKVLISEDITTTSSAKYYHTATVNIGTTADIYAFLAADYAKLTVTGDATTSNGLTEENYTFTSASPASSWGCSGAAGSITVDGSSLQIMENDYFDMKGRFAGGTRSGGLSYWYILRNNGGLQEGSANASKSFAILNLTAGDYITINYKDNGATFTFHGDNNITGLEKGTSIVSGLTYKIEKTGDLLINVARSGTNYPTFYSIVIATSKPVLERPTLVFNNMVESSGLYNPKFMFTTSCNGSSVAGASYTDGSSNDITSGYTFTEAGTLTVYASKDGYTKSARATYTVTDKQVGMIRKPSVNPVL